MNAWTPSGIAGLALLALGGAGCGGGGSVRTPDGLVGHALDDAVARFGAPAADTSLVVRRGDRLPELQSGLYPAVLDTLADGRAATVRELRWRGSPQRAVWAVERGGQWVVVDVAEWASDVQF